MQFWKVLFLLGFLFAALSSQARVFDYKDSSLGAYIRGTGGLSAAGKEAFIHSSGPGTTVDGTSNYSYSGEIGFAFAIGTDTRLRLGAEVIQHRPVKDTAGLNAAGDELFALESTIFVFNPNVTIEHAFKTVGNTRFFFAFGAGLADVTVENRYAMTATGSAQLSASSYNEKLQANAISGHVNTGVETLFTDNATVLFDVGYRYLPIPSLKYKSSETAIGGPIVKGGTALNNNGTKRAFDLGGLYTGITFRFYLNFL